MSVQKEKESNDKAPSHHDIFSAVSCFHLKLFVRSVGDFGSRSYE